MRGFKNSKKKKTLYVRIDCEACGRWECLPCYEDEVEKRKFMRIFWECKNCHHIICEICSAGDKTSKVHEEKPVNYCPFCGHKRLREVTPKKIYEEFKYIQNSEEAVVLVVPVSSMK